MPSLGTMKARIADELARDDLTSQIAAAIVSAVAHYERRPWWFMETEGTFNTAPGTDAYTTSTATFLSTLVDEDSLTMTVNGSKEPLRKIAFAEMQDYRIDTVPSGPPTHYAMYRQRLYVHPVPDRTYSATVFFTGNIGVPAADGDSNSWTNEGEELIRLRAKADLFENVIRDYAEADRMRGREIEVLRSLQGLHSNRTATGFLVAEDF
jgi:hypothetical protein